GGSGLGRGPRPGLGGGARVAFPRAALSAALRTAAGGAPLDAPSLDWNPPCRLESASTVVQTAQVDSNASHSALPRERCARRAARGAGALRAARGPQRISQPAESPPRRRPER